VKIWPVFVTLIGLGMLMPAEPAGAQMTMGDPSAAAPFGAPMDDDRIFYHLLFDQLEGRFGRDDSFRWEGEGWAGTDMNRLLLKTEGTLSDGTLQDGDQELLYARPINSYFNVQGGIRYDLDSAPGRGWAAFGVEGLAPLFFHVSATGYVSDAGQLAGRLEGNYDLLLTQTLILEPQLEMNFYSKDDQARGIRAGLADLDTGLRLRYEITRKVAPYIGVAYENRLEDGTLSGRTTPPYSSDLRLSAGIRIWF
jgi:copper resistance protein B